MRTLIIAAALVAAVSPVAAKTPPKINNETGMYLRMLTEAYMAKRFCNAQINHGFFEEYQTRVNMVDAKLATKVMEYVEWTHRAVLKNPKGFCDDYRAYLKGYTFAVDGPAFLR